MAFCSNCGAEVAQGSAFCAKCGKPSGAAGATGAAAAAAPAPATTQSSGLNDNVAGLLAYLFIPAIVFLCIEPYNKNKTIRFHSFQGLGLGLVSIVGHIILSLIPFIGWVIIPFFSLAILVVAIIAAIKAFQGGRFNIPIIAGQAEKMANQ